MNTQHHLISLCSHMQLYNSHTSLHSVSSKVAATSVIYKFRASNIAQRRLQQIFKFSTRSNRFVLATQWPRQTQPPNGLAQAGHPAWATTKRHGQHGQPPSGLAQAGYPPQTCNMTKNMTHFDSNLKFVVIGRFAVALVMSDVGPDVMSGIYD